MGRVINPDNPGKLRNQHMRTAAEILRRLSQKQGVDDEVRDMISTLVFVFREIDEGIEAALVDFLRCQYVERDGREVLRRAYDWL